MDEAPAGAVKILLMDDDPALLNLVQLALSAEGYEVRTANNGKEGIKLIEQEMVDLVVTDLVMPGLEGLESIIHLRKSHPEVKIIAMSAGLRKGKIDMLPAALSLGAHRTLRKPFAIEALLSAVNELLEETGDGHLSPWPA